MTHVDQFESVFRAADKPVFNYAPPALSRVLLVTDLADPEPFLQDVQSYLSVVGPDADWVLGDGVQRPDLRTLLELVEAERPDLIVTYRNLHTESWHWPYSLGEHLDVLTQATATPVLVVPHPEAGRAAPHSLEDTDTVLALTDHLAGDGALVSMAARLTAPGGLLWLAHVEDEHSFERVATAISKIPTIPTDEACAELHAQLLKEPRDYIESCRAGLESAGLQLDVREHVTGGRRLAEVRALIESHDVDLVVMRTKDEDQLAMHGLAYPLAVELRHIPLLLL